MRILFTMSLIIFFLSSCAKKEHTSSIAIDIFNDRNARTIDIEKIETDYLIAYPECMLWVGNGHLIIKDEMNHECLFHLLDIKTGKLLSDFVRKGQGPDEYASSTLNVHLHQDGQQLSFFDPNGRRYHTFAPTEDDISLGYKHISSHVITSIPAIREVIVAKQGYILTGENGRFDSHRFVSVDENWNIENSSGTYPDLKPLLGSDENYRQMIYSTVMYKTAPSKNKAVFATYRGALLQLLDISNYKDSVKTIKSILLNRPIKTEQIEPNHAGWVYGFEDIYATDHYVYAIYNGQTAKENPMLGKNILVYDWNGQIVNTYKTELNLRCIAVDEAQNTAYVIACEEDGEFFLGQCKL